jgi:hypothetical protein
MEVWVLRAQGIHEFVNALTSRVRAVIVPPLQLRSVDPEEEMDLPLAQSEGEDGEGEGESDDGEPDTEVDADNRAAAGAVRGEEAGGDGNGVKMQQEVGLLDHREPDGDLDGDEMPLSGGSDEDEKVPC